MTCQEFLARHSEFLDAVMDPLDSARCLDHVTSCASCARYDRIVRRGRGLVQDLPHAEPSSDFFPRLQHRIYSLEESMDAEGRAGGAGALVSLAVAGTLALLAWGPMLRNAGWTMPWTGADVPERVAGQQRVPVAPEERRTRPARPLRDGGWSVQLAAEGETAPPPPADSTPDGTARIGVPAPAAASGFDAWKWRAGRMNAWDATAPVIRAVRSAEFHVPGPYSPLVIGAPTHLRASLVRSIDAPTGHD